MPKPIYGKGRSSKAGRAGESAGDETANNGWLTLITTLPEQKQHDAILAALKEGGPSQLSSEPETCDGLAPSLVEYATTRGADCDEAWLGLIVELFGDMGVALAGDDADGSEDAEREGATELLAALRRHKVVCTEPPPPPPLKPGVAVLAVLEEDGEWHNATVEKVVLAPSGEGPPQIVVKFDEWPKVQETQLV